MRSQIVLRDGAVVIPGVRLFRIYSPGRDYSENLFQLFIDLRIRKIKDVQKGFSWFAPSFDEALNMAKKYCKDPKNKNKLHLPIKYIKQPVQLSLF